MKAAKHTAQATTRQVTLDTFFSVRLPTAAHSLRDAPHSDTSTPQGSSTISAARSAADASTNESPSHSHLKHDAQHGVSPQHKSRSGQVVMCSLVQGRQNGVAASFPSDVDDDDDGGDVPLSAFLFGADVRDSAAPCGDGARHPCRCDGEGGERERQKGCAGRSVDCATTCGSGSGSSSAGLPVPLAAPAQPSLLPPISSPSSSPSSLPSSSQHSAAPPAHDHHTVSSPRLPVSLVGPPYSPVSGGPRSSHFASGHASTGRAAVTQTTLDFGQSGCTDAGQRCPRCNMLFTANAEDVALHRRVCRALAKEAQRKEARWSVTQRVTCIRGGVASAVSPQESETTRVTGQAARTPFSLSSASISSVFSWGKGIAALTLAGALRRGQEMADTLEMLAGQQTVKASAGKGATESRKRKTRDTARPKSCVPSALARTGLHDGGGTRGVVCTRFPSASPAGATTQPLDVFLVQLSPAELSDGPADHHSQRCPVYESMVHLLQCSGLTHLLFERQRDVRSNSPLSPSHSTQRHQHRASGEPSAMDATIVIVFVVHQVLRLPLCCVVGRRAHREQDPELLLRPRAGGEGGVVCFTHRRFTFANVTDFGVVSLDLLAAAEHAWEAANTAMYKSTHSVMESFFKAATPTATHKEELTSQSSSTALQWCRKQAVGVALHTLSRSLVYGQTLNPIRELSYARSVIATCSSAASDGPGASRTGPEAPPHPSGTAMEMEAVPHLGEGWLMDCLRAADTSPLLPLPQGSATSAATSARPRESPSITGSAAVGEEDEDEQSLFLHDDEGGSDTDHNHDDDDDEMCAKDIGDGCFSVASDNSSSSDGVTHRFGEATDGSATGRKRRRKMSSERELSVVSYASDG